MIRENCINFQGQKACLRAFADIATEDRVWRWIGLH